MNHQEKFDFVSVDRDSYLAFASHILHHGADLNCPPLGPPLKVPGPEDRHAESGLLQAEVRLPGWILGTAPYLVSA